MSAFPSCAYAALPNELTSRLQLNVRNYARALRRAGAQPEQVVRLTKSLVARNAGTGDVYASRLMDTTVNLTIDEFYSM